MNPWDIVTWISAIALAVSALVIFGFFLRDARGILERDLHHSDEDSATDETNDETP
ncbi:MAG: hypothetical protein IH884_10925 [Myxococcales bacterium]|nr:hypothetical protein [Myxococcales bacterium]